jgi:hypothetical protein
MLHTAVQYHATTLALAAVIISNRIYHVCGTADKATYLWLFCPLSEQLLFPCLFLNIISLYTTIMSASKLPEPIINAANLSHDEREVFNDDKSHSIKYQTLSWQSTAYIMITEVVTGGTLTLPQAIAVVGLVPGTIIIVFCGVWALFTSFLLIDFKLNHPEVHNMGDAGFILFSPFGLGAVGREVMSTGTILFAITGVGSMGLLGQLALQTLSQGGMCAMSYLGIWTCVTFLVAVPRTFGAGLQGFSLAACISILVATLVAMIGSGVKPTPDRVVVATAPNTFYTAFLAITNPGKQLEA